MSRPGFWKSKDKPEIAITDMEDSHLHNAMKYIYRRMFPRDKIESGLSDSLEDYYENKLIELGNEAERRQLIPLNLRYEDLLELIETWCPYPASSNEVIPKPPTTRTSIAAKLAINCDVASFTQLLIYKSMPKFDAESTTKVRKITFDL